MLWLSIFTSILYTVSCYTFTRKDPPCESKDLKCMKVLVRDVFEASLPGIKELGVEPLDPLHQKIIENEHANMKYSLTDSIVTGFKNLVINEVTVDQHKSMHLDITIPYYEITGNYKISGTILNGKPIEGEGKYFFNATELHIQADVSKQFYDVEGKKHIMLTNLKTSVEPLGKLYFDAGNLYKGNKKMFVACILCSVCGYKFPVPNPKCDVNDFKCLGGVASDMFKLSVQGVPERSILPLDPLNLPLIEEELADIKYTLTDSIVTGLKDAIINEVSLVYRKSMHFDITVPYYEMKGNYKISGTVLNLHADGEGKYFFNATDTHLLVDANKEYKVRDGKLYSQFTDIKTKTELLGAVHFDVDNLFDGNKAKADPVLTFIKESPKAATALWERKVTESVLKVVFDGFNEMLKDVPVSDITTDDKL